MPSWKTLAAACALAALTPATAHADLTKWTAVTPPVSNTSELGLARTADGALHVAYADQNGGERIMHTAIPANGKGVTAPTVIAGMTTVNTRVALVREAGGGLRAFFSG